MPNITKRTNKAGEVISYRIRVSRGYDAQGKKLKPYEMTWKPAPNMSEKAAEKEVQRQALLFEEQCKTGLSGDATKITLAEFIPVYLEQKKPSLSPSTYAYYERAIESKILPALGHHKLKDIKPVHVQAFIQQLCRGRKSKRYRKTAFTGYYSTKSYYFAIYYEISSEAAYSFRESSKSRIAGHSKSNPT